MREIDWVKHKLHRGQVVRDHGRWLGLLDEDWIPKFDLPQVTKLDWPHTRGAIDAVSMTLRVRTPSGRTHAVVDELVAEGLGQVDAVGKLIPVTGPARLVVMEQAGMKRRMMRITHVKAEGDATAPHTLTIFGVSALGYLDLLPCPSNPLSWAGKFTRFERDWVGPEESKALFTQPRDLAPCTMITVADGASVDGKADEVVHRLIRESLDAVHRTAGITQNPPYAVVLDPPRGEPQRMIHRPTDQTIWQEIGERALSAGVSLWADLWWPEDPTPPGLALQLPTLVFHVRQEG